MTTLGTVYYVACSVWRGSALINRQRELQRHLQASGPYRLLFVCVSLLVCVAAEGSTGEESESGAENGRQEAE